jgi:hypothetical integral membrane protein (TIGR02206 family)
MANDLPTVVAKTADAVESTFVYMDAPHIFCIVLTVTLPLLLASWIRRSDSERVRKGILWTIGSLMVANELLDQVYHISTLDRHTYLTTWLPLHLCDISVILVIVLMFWRKHRVFEVVYFWGVAGASQSILTPDLTVGFPSVTWLCYFIAHCGIIIGILVSCWGLKMRVTFSSLLRSFLIANIYAVGLIFVNLALGANYMFLCEIPAGESPFFFAPWPWYILVLEPFAFLLFCVVYLPFLPGELKLRRERQAELQECLADEDGRTP